MTGKGRGCVATASLDYRLGLLEEISTLTSARQHAHPHCPLLRPGDRRSSCLPLMCLLEPDVINDGGQQQAKPSSLRALDWLAGKLLLGISCIWLSCRVLVMSSQIVLLLLSTCNVDCF